MNQRFTICTSPEGEVKTSHPACQDEKSDLVNRAVARRLTLCQRLGLKVLVGDLAILSCRNVFEHKQQITTITLRLLLWKMVWYWDLMMSEPWNQEMIPEKGLGSKDLCSSTNCRTFDPKHNGRSLWAIHVAEMSVSNCIAFNWMVVFQPLHVNFVRVSRHPPVFLEIRGSFLAKSWAMYCYDWLYVWLPREGSHQ